MANIPQNHFDRSQIPPARSFYERELGKIGKPDRRGWALTNCPFHKSKSGRSFSVNVESGGFYCFGCQEKGGDLVAFLRKRDRLSFPDACKQLGCWKAEGLDSEAQKRITEQREARERQQRETEERKEQERQERIAARTQLHRLESDYSRAAVQLTHLRRGAVERYRGEERLAWWFLADTLPRIRQAEAHYWRKAGLEVVL